MIHRRQLDVSFLGKDSLQQELQHWAVASFRHFDSFAQQLLLSLLKQRPPDDGGLIFRAGSAAGIAFGKRTTAGGALAQMFGLGILVHSTHPQYAQSGAQLLPLIRGQGKVYGIVVFKFA
jgi:hypothetical protein